VQSLFQDPYGPLNPFLTGLDAVAESAHVHQKVSRSDAKDIGRTLLADGGLAPDAFQRRPRKPEQRSAPTDRHRESACCRPDIITADEPTLALEVSVQAQILNLLLALQQHRAIGLVLVSHDPGVVRLLTEHVLVMLRGEVIERGPTDELLRDPGTDYTKLWLPPPHCERLISGAQIALWLCGTRVAGLGTTGPWWRSQHGGSGRF
jgi:peptide/nickel transport system ATP-binding protein